MVNRLNHITLILLLFSGSCSAPSARCERPDNLSNVEYFKYYDRQHDREAYFVRDDSKDMGAQYLVVYAEWRGQDLKSLLRSGEPEGLIMNIKKGDDLIFISGFGISIRKNIRDMNMWEYKDKGELVKCKEIPKLGNASVDSISIQCSEGVDSGSIFTYNKQRGLEYIENSYIGKMELIGDCGALYSGEFLKLI